MVLVSEGVLHWALVGPRFQRPAPPATLLQQKKQPQLISLYTCGVCDELRHQTAGSVIKLGSYSPSFA
ncbi:hypothetical protein SLE2022_008570 [Rubroshorea leprosula]